MIVDNNLLLSGSVSAAGVATGQTVTGTGSFLSTNTVDLSQVRDVGEGEDIYARIQASVAQAGATSVEVQVITADDAALTTNINVLATTGPLAIASWGVGARQAIKVSGRLNNKGQRYLGLRYVIVGTSSAGAFFGDLGVEAQGGGAMYPGGFAVL
jgi:hypothetical protein